MIPFTQFMRPDGHAKRVEIDRPPGVESEARKLLDAGCRFEIEMLTTGEISMTCERGDDDEEPLAHEVCLNGPDVPLAVDRMIATAANAAISLENSR